MTNAVTWSDIPVYLVGNRQDLQAWQSDPRPLLMERQRFGLLVVAPNHLDSFLSPKEFDHCPIRFIHGAKGSGKTSLLLAKRTLLEPAVQSRHVLCVPASFPYVFSPFMESAHIVFDSWESLAFADKEVWKYAWLVLLGAFILDAVDRSVEKDIAAVVDRHVEKSVNAEQKTPLLSQNVVRLLTGQRSATKGALEETKWVDYFKNLINHAQKNPLEQYKRMYEEEIVESLRMLSKSISRPIFVFVDGIDETFNGPNNSPLLTLVKSRKMKELLQISKGPDATNRDSNSDPEELARQIWVNAQISLVSVGTELSISSGGIVKLVGSMRSEAYLDLEQGAQSAAQLASFIKPIKYTRRHLEAIVRANIRISMNAQKLEEPAKKDELDSYFGTSTFQDIEVGIDEPIFQYLCRHTFEEPRDLMVFCEAMRSALNDGESVLDTHEALSSTLRQILMDYFKFMDEPWDGAFETGVFKHIPTNLFDREVAASIAACVKEEGKVDEDHPLCYLYQRGLIGFVSGQGVNARQTFRRPSQVKKEERLSLPSSNVYLVHPILDWLIKEARTRSDLPTYQLIRGMPVGNNLPWIPGMRMKRVQLQVDGGTITVFIDGHELSSLTGTEVDGDIRSIPAQNGRSAEKARQGRKASSGAKLPRFQSLNDVPTAIFYASLKEMTLQKSNSVTLACVLDEIRLMIDAGFLRATVRRGGRRPMPTVKYIEEVWEKPAQPPFIESINRRLAEYNFMEISFGRSQSNASILVKGVDWGEISITQLRSPSLQ